MAVGYSKVCVHLKGPLSTQPYEPREQGSLKFPDHSFGIIKAHPPSTSVVSEQWNAIYTETQAQDFLHQIDQTHQYIFTFNH